MRHDKHILTLCQSWKYVISPAATRSRLRVFQAFAQWYLISSQFKVRRFAKCVSLVAHFKRWRTFVKASAPSAYPGFSKDVNGIGF